MIKEDTEGGVRRFSKPVSEVDPEEFRIWHGHDLADPKGLPTPDGLAAELGHVPDVLEVPAGDWDKAVVYTGFGQEVDGNRFAVAHTLHLVREMESQEDALALFREATVEAAGRYGDVQFAPSSRDGAFAQWRIDDPTIDWGWPRAEARIRRNGNKVTADYQFFLQDRPASMRRFGKMRPLGSPGGSRR